MGGSNRASEGGVCVIVCTRNRAEALQTALEFWRYVDTHHLSEMVLVDNGSTDSTLAVMKAFAANAPFSVRLVSEPAPGLARARNAGLDHARGEIILFTDDDCYPAIDFVTNCWQIFQQFPEVGFLGGRVLLYDLRDLRTSIKESEEISAIESYSVVEAGVIHGANMGFRRSLITTVGKFDERFGAGTLLKSAEDTEYLARASWKGFSGLYHPVPTVYHHHGRRSLEDRDKIRAGYALGRGAYFLKFVLTPKSSLKYTKYWWWRLRGLSANERRLELRGAMLMLKGTKGLTR